METTDVLYIVDMNEAQEWVCTAIRDDDVKMLSVAYVNGFIGRHLLCNGSCDACKACLISEAQLSTDVYIGFKESILLPIQLRSWQRLLVLLSLF
jgi:predicted metal-binding protein